MSGAAVPVVAPPPAAQPIAQPSVDLADIYAEHFDAIWHHLRRMGVARADRDDLAQEVFLVVHRRLATFDRTQPMRPWLVGICTRVVLHHWRSARRRPADRATEADFDELEGTAASSPDHAARQLLAALLATLDHESRASFILHELEGFSVPEIAELTETPLNTVYSRLRRTRLELTELARRWHQEGRHGG